MSTNQLSPNIKNIPFNKPHLTNKELINIEKVFQSHHLSGDGNFTKRCNQWLEKQIGCEKALLTHSCTAALEMAAILANIQPGDEVIMPSYTFVSTANAFVLRGGVPVFIDIRPDTLNINEKLIEDAITPKTKAIVPVHYAGVGCEMEEIMAIAKKYNLLVIEDAAQGLISNYKGKSLGTFGHLSAISFHETKNIISGEGGALLINDKKLCERAEIIREKGTNRSKFFRGEVDKYTWTDIGSSYLPSEIIAAFLFAQLEEADKITNQRIKVWNQYHSNLEILEQAKKIRRPIIPKNCEHNAHMYYLIVKNIEVRTKLINYLKNQGINPVFHYIPLHSSPAGIRYGKTVGTMEVTNRISEQLVRLPLWPDLKYEKLIIEHLINFFS